MNITSAFHFIFRSDHAKKWWRQFLILFSLESEGRNPLKYYLLLLFIHSFLCKGTWNVNRNNYNYSNYSRQSCGSLRKYSWQVKAAYKLNQTKKTYKCTYLFIFKKKISHFFLKFSPSIIICEHNKCLKVTQKVIVLPVYKIRTQKNLPSRLEEYLFYVLITYHKIRKFQLHTFHSF